MALQTKKSNQREMEDISDDPKTEAVVGWRETYCVRCKIRCR